MAKQITISQLKCLNCGHEWLPRSVERPRICPKCKSARWDVGPRAPRKPRNDAGLVRGPQHSGGQDKADAEEAQRVIAASDPTQRRSLDDLRQAVRG